MTEPQEGELTGCAYCPGIAEPEQAGDMLFYACTLCGGEFGYRRVVSETLLCAAGLPVDFAATGRQSPGGLPLESEGERRSVFLGVTITRRSE